MRTFSKDGVKPNPFLSEGSIIPSQGDWCHRDNHGRWCLSLSSAPPTVLLPGPSLLNSTSASSLFFAKVYPAAYFPLSQVQLPCLLFKALLILASPYFSQLSALAKYSLYTPLYVQWILCLASVLAFSDYCLFPTPLTQGQKLKKKKKRPSSSSTIFTKLSATPANENWNALGVWCLEPVLSLLTIELWILI